MFRRILLVATFFLAACTPTDVVKPPEPPPPITLRIVIPEWSRACTLLQGKGLACDYNPEALATQNCLPIQGQAVTACLRDELTPAQADYWLTLHGQFNVTTPVRETCLTVANFQQCWERLPVWDLISNPQLRCHEGTPEAPRPGPPNTARAIFPDKACPL